MNQKRWQEIEVLFNSASQLSDSEQIKFITDSCGSDFDLQQELISLLEQLKTNASFLEESIVNTGFSLLNQQEKDIGLQKGQVLGAYKILRPLGTGGMGEVYLAEDTRLSRKVALKILPAFAIGSLENTRRFRLEALAASKVVHPNVAHIYEFSSISDDSGRHFIVMEYVAGETLREVIKRKSLKSEEVLQIAAQIARAIAAAHSAGVIHRDIKPENIIVNNTGERESFHVKVLDFGLAKLNEISYPEKFSSTDFEFKTNPGLLLGTTAYMSPEQIRGEDVDHRTDIWSFGVVLYELLTGETPFKGNSPAEFAANVLNKWNNENIELKEAANSNVVRIVNRSLAKNPAHRFQSAQDLVFALETIENNSLLQFFSFDTSGRKAKKAKQWIYMAASIIFLGTLFLIGSFVQGNKGFFSSADKSPLSSSINTENATASYNQITFRRGTIWNARFAPGGQTVIYSAGWNGEKINIFSVRQLSNESRSFNLRGTNLLSISAKGEMALLKPEKYLYQFIQRGTLQQMQIEGSAPRNVAENVQEADFSPDGENLAISRWSAADGRNLLEYPIGKVLYETSGYVSSLRVSPDGGSVAFLDHPRQWDNRGYVAVVDGLGNKKVITDEWSGIEGLAWNSSTGEIWFTASKAGEAYALYATTPAGKTRLVNRIPGNLILYDISQNGQVLLSRAFQSTDVYGCAAARGEKSDRNLSWLRLVGIGDLAADGSTFIFTHFGEGSGKNYAVYLRNTDGSPAVRLGEGRALALSPDKKFVLAKLNDPEQLNILPVNAGQVRVLPRGNIEEYERAQWFPDGERIVFTGKLKGEESKRTFVMDLRTGEFDPVTPPGVTGTQISPNGDRLIVQTTAGEKKIFLLRENKLSSINNLTADEEIIGWGEDNKSLFVFRLFEIPLKIEQLNLKTGRRQLIKIITPNDQSGVFGPPYVFLTPDGKNCIYGLRRYLFDLFITENLN